MSGGTRPTVAEDLTEQPEAVKIRLAAHADVPAVAVGVNELLVELGGAEAELEDIEATASALIEDPDAGAVLVAEVQGSVVGVLAASWQSAMRIPGRYGLIQELWVHPDRRCEEIGAELMTALFDHTRRMGIDRLEVGLPSERYPHLAATESFYVTSGFTSIGLRMRWLA